MSLVVNTNLASLDARRNQAKSGNDLSTAISRLSSGLRINSAKDDAAGLAIADRFTAQIRGTTQAGRNANDGISLAQTAEGALASIDDNLQRIRELAVQSANATNSASDRASLQLEVAQLQSEIDRVATQTQFNGVNLLDGSFAGQSFQVGADAGQTINLNGIANARAAALGTYRGFALHGLAPPFGAGGTISINIAFSFAASPIPVGVVEQDAKAIAAAFNALGEKGLTAQAHATSATGSSAAYAVSSGTASFNLNGVVISLVGTTGAAGLASNRSNALAAINAQSAATGVVATDTGSGLTLTAADGRNIAQAFTANSFVNSNANDFGLPVASFIAGTYDLDYVAPPSVTGVLLGYATVPFATATTIAFWIGNIGGPVSGIDISSSAGANAALRSIDTALATVSSARAGLGAAQNRLASAVGNLQTADASLSASRSRIQDADFAAETANLSRAQVLQQAGTAMIAQANQQPGQVLALLRSG